MTTESTPVLQARNVTKHFDVRDSFGRSSTVRAVENASIAVHSGSIVALVGESGSGKTTLARMLARFYPVTSGEILMDGEPISPKGYYRNVQLVFQDPFGSLNNLHRVRYILGRALKIAGRAKNSAQTRELTLELLQRVSLTPAEEIIDAFPHELSGGQRQRLSIARALAIRPRVLLADEPISMLDVSIRLDILNLLAKLRDEEGLGMLYITHDIASARYLCDSIQVMYAGQSIEGGATDSVILEPKHPYTQLLLESSPDPSRSGNDRESFAAIDDVGEPPNLADPPPGCRFHPRCPHAMDVCRKNFPPRTEFADGSWTHCWLHDKPVPNNRQDAS